MITKKQIREAVLEERNNMDEESAALASQVICRKILDIDVYEEAENICLYMPTGSEVDVMLLAEVAEEEGRRVWIPKVIKKAGEKEAGEMVFTRFEGMDSVETGAYGILESTSDEILELKKAADDDSASGDTIECGSAEGGSAEEKTLVIMPGVAFTPWKDRLGYGGGFYDRFLREHPDCSTIGACYDLQLVPELPTDEHDLKPDYVVSETSIYR